MSKTESKKVATPETRFGSLNALPIRDASSELTRQIVSPDGLAFTIQLNPWVIELAADSPSDVAVVVASIEVPISTPGTGKEKFEGLTTRLIGHIDKDAGTRVAITVDAGGETRTVEFPYGSAVTSGINHRLFGFDSFSIPPVLSDGGDGTGQATVAISASKYILTIVVTIQRRAPAHQAIVYIDTLEAAISDFAAR